MSTKLHGEPGFDQPTMNSDNEKFKQKYNIVEIKDLVKVVKKNKEEYKCLVIFKDKAPQWMLLSDIKKDHPLKIIQYYEKVIKWPMCRK